MTDQPNHGRDIKSDILRVLANEGPLTIRGIQQRLVGWHPTGAPPSRSTVTRHVGELYRLGLVRCTGFGPRGAAMFGVTAWGSTHAVAEARGLVRGAEP